jgi:hypothetical protein
MIKLDIQLLKEAGGRRQEAQNGKGIQTPTKL